MKLGTRFGGRRGSAAPAFPTLFVFLVAAALGNGIRPSPARAQDAIHGSIPQKWIDPLLVEDLPELKYPAYFDDLDKAKAQSWAGRYKLSLHTLRKITDPKPEQLVTVAWVKGRSLAALGKTDEALKVLSDSTKVKPGGKDKDKPETAVADDPRVQLLRRQVLSDAGRVEEALALLREFVKATPRLLDRPLPAGRRSNERVGNLDAARAAVRLLRRRAARHPGQVGGRRARRHRRRRAAGQRRGSRLLRPRRRPLGHAQREVPRQQRPAEDDPQHLRPRRRDRPRLLARPRGGGRVST